MKIVCDNCATKYSIADEKVRGKVFKIRCKKCSHIIVVRGNENGEPVRESEEPAPAISSSPTPAPASGDSVWHLVVNGEQVGPMTPAEIRAKFAASEVDAETYAWREGFGDWLRLGSIEDFKDLASAAPAPAEEGQTRRTDAADLFARAAADEASNQDAGSDLFGSSPAAASAAAKPAPAASDVFAPASSNLFGATAQAAASDSAPAPAARQPRASAPAVSAAPAGEGMSAEANPKMAGQRNENSVLFSLNNLQALASSNGAPSKQGGPAPAAKAGVDNRPGFANSQTEGSGLIDIRAMAASTLAAGPSTSSNSSRPDDLPPLAAPPIFSPMAAPIMMAAPSQGMPKYMYAVLGIGGLLVVCFIVVTVLILTKKDPVVVAPPPVVTQPVAVNTPPVKAGPAVPGDVKGTSPTPAETAKADAPPAADEPKEKGKKPSSSGKPHAETGKKAEKPQAAAPEVAPPPTKPAATKKGKDDLDDLLNQASPGSKKSAPAAKEKEPAGGDDLPDQLGKAEIVGGMKKVSGKVADCYNQFKVPGMASVSVTIAKSGSVSSANVGGAFAGTPTGSCVERAVKSGSFPKFKGPSQTITYPFVLR